MESLAEFLHMGGYAFYVWTSYAIVAVALIVNLWFPLTRGRQLRRRLRRSMRGSGVRDGERP